MINGVAHPSDRFWYLHRMFTDKSGWDNLTLALANSYLNNGLERHLRLHRTSKTTNTQITTEEAERNSRMESNWGRLQEVLGEDEYMNGEQEEDLEYITL